jgi:hypothetical protein
MFSLRKAVGAVALAGTVLGFAACGGSSAPDAQDVTVDTVPIAVRHAAESTAAQPTAHVDTTIDMTIKDRHVSLAGSGQLDAPNQRFMQKFDMTDFFAPLMKDAPAGATVPFTAVVDGPTTYVQFPAFAAASGGKPWMKFDAATSGTSMGELFGGSGGGAFTSDPSSFVRFLEGAGKVTEVGPESVRGTVTTHYSGTYSINDAVSSMTQDQRDRITKAFDQLGFPLNARDEPIGFDAWIGSDGLVRRVSTTFDTTKLDPDATTDLGQIQVTVEYSDFGAPVDIEVPPADQVQELSTLVPQVN